MWIYRRLIGRSYIAFARQDQYIGNILDTLKTQILNILVFVAVLHLHLQHIHSAIAEKKRKRESSVHQKCLHEPISTITFSSPLLSSLDLHSFSSDLKNIFNNLSSTNLQTVIILLKVLCVSVSRNISAIYPMPASEKLFCKYIGG